MRDVTLRFISDLRAAGLRISVSESMDAMQAVAAVGVERGLLQEALAASLVKEEEDRPLFDDLFARFFTAPGPRRKGKHHEQVSSGEGQRTAAKGAQLRASERPPEQRRPGEPSAHEPSERASEQERKQRLESLREQQLESKQEGNKNLIPDAQHPAPSLRANRKALLEKPFKAFDARDVEATKELLEELARRLRGHLSRRYKHGKRGRLDFRRTIRASISHGGVPLETRLRHRRPGKPDLIALCDLSGSVAVVSDFLLALLAPAAEYFRNVRTFAYVDRLCEVSFEQGHVVPHTALDLYALSDFGKVLQQFWQEHGERLLTRSTLILILGDARNNRRPPRPDLLARLRDHAKKLIWLNPEPRERWDTGDSVMSRYAPVCDVVLGCGNLRELVSALRQTL
ncbi:MAG TPA: VWA domain-containing protein [Candidatus Binatia bacterium]|jgi:hypothetical protein|nr:VWA domain-containing protein [Candidatus Binatia bacterium]